MRCLQFEQFIKGNPEEIFRFFSSPANLALITPPSMDFRITSKVPEKMYEGMLISYTLKPLWWFKVKWVTEITHVVENTYFVDEQRIGPYRLWHHEHHFYQAEGGLLMKDILYYQIPFGILGSLIDKLLVNRRVQYIFHFRKQRINKLFA